VRQIYISYVCKHNTQEHLSPVHDQPKKCFVYLIKYSFIDSIPPVHCNTDFNLNVENITIIILVIINYAHLIE
jgi:hypothetical protein